MIFLYFRKYIIIIMLVNCKSALFYFLFNLGREFLLFFCPLRYIGPAASDSARSHF